MFADLDYDVEEDKLGIPTVPGTVTLKKDSQNLIGISIGGGAQYCPCLYIVQVFDNTPAALDGTVAAGDEITGVNGKSVKGKTKVEVAKMIQMVKGEVTIHYNKLQADPKQGKSLDIVLKKVKHRLVENMSSGTADALGLSRAILCNDGLVKRLEELERTAELYKGLTEHTKSLLRAFFELSQTHRAFGDVFSVIGVREPQPAASEAFVKFADAHRNIEKFGIHLLKTIKPMLTDLNTYLNKAIPDTRLTIKKYLDVKFEYLSYCLKVKEMDDEEYSCIALGEPLYRVSTGNYEYRLILRCLDNRLGQGCLPALRIPPPAGTAIPGSKALCCSPLRGISPSEVLPSCTLAAAWKSHHVPVPQLYSPLKVLQREVVTANAPTGSAVP
uniref:PRKCA-binding protein n=1 Tax=Coturnix japonica TaxID=93934 RepID=A0A8C2TRD9_COTJA